MFTRRAAFGNILKPRAARLQMSNFSTQNSSEEQNKKVITSAQWRSEKFRKREGIISTFFQAYFFGRTNLMLIEKQERSGGMLPRKVFENLHAVMAVLVLFK